MTKQVNCDIFIGRAKCKSVPEWVASLSYYTTFVVGVSSEHSSDSRYGRDVLYSRSRPGQSRGAGHHRRRKTDDDQSATIPEGHRAELAVPRGGDVRGERQYQVLGCGRSC